MSQPWILAGEQSGLLTHIATTESVSLCVLMKGSQLFLRLSPVNHCASQIHSRILAPRVCRPAGKPRRIIEKSIGVFVGVSKAACARESLETVRSVEVIRTADHCLKSLTIPSWLSPKGPAPLISCISWCFLSCLLFKCSGF